MSSLGGPYHGFRYLLTRVNRTGNTRILGIVDGFTNIVTYLPCRKYIDSPELPGRFFKHVICQHSIPDNVTTDHSKQFTWCIWNRVRFDLRIIYRLSTALNPQTDSQAERQKQTMEQYLQAGCYYEEDNWVELLLLAESAYNHSIQNSKLNTPIWANYKYHPMMQLKSLKDTGSRSQVRADLWMAGLEETHRILPEHIIQAQE